jgi:hypothetical protein
MNGISNINDMWNGFSLQLNSFQFVSKKNKKKKACGMSTTKSEITLQKKHPP